MFRDADCGKRHRHGLGIQPGTTGTMANSSLRKSWIPQHKGVTRLLFYANRAHMGTYREAVQAYLNGTDATPTITAHEHFGALKYGFGYNTEQELTSSLRVFGRFGWNEGQHESFAYTEVDQTVRLAQTMREIAGTARRTRLRLRWCRMRSSAITRIICGWADSGFFSATAI